MVTPTENKTGSPLIPAIVSVVGFSGLAGIIVLVIGVEYGATLFALVPILAGFVSGLRTSTLRAATAVFSVGVFVCLLVLLLSGSEGVICVGMALPLIFISGLLGAWLAQFIKRSGGGPNGSVISVLLALVLVGCSAALEKPYMKENPNQSITMSRVFSSNIDDTWEALLRFQTVTGHKPLLLKLGLPVPLYCTLEGSGIGATRICHFDQGTIEERISVWDPPSELEMQITKVTLPGRDWLKFVDATYKLKSLGNGKTEVHRITRYNSVLRPRLYWQPLEEIGTQAEHQYLFNALARKLGEPDV